MRDGVDWITDVWNRFVLLTHWLAFGNGITLFYEPYYVDAPRKVRGQIDSAPCKTIQMPSYFPISTIPDVIKNTLFTGPQLPPATFCPIVSKLMASQL